MTNEYTPYALVVDDDPLIMMDAVLILEEAGFRTYEAHDVASALGVLSEYAENIQLLFTDVEMPGENNGFYLARRCAELYPEISILVASGRMAPQPSDMPDGSVFVGKPFSAEVVYERLLELLPDGAKPEPLQKRAIA